ncbi:hypothetical protein [Novosphingobium sp. 9U]|uniref:hypothetical protein n=1 Tax=Novosphingobium sp. 9U TaxID=2653158 RepID=UPI0012F46AB8|nr:hypothetical protein [Novosphingobium sp. 9U]VWX51397.1 exported hypothetical protein [Novosphingobium sp. 9U]
MRIGAWLCAASAAATMLPQGALADNPHDPTMTPEAIARDRETIRKMNLDQLAYVRQRDARYAGGWQDYAEARPERRLKEADDYGARSQAYAQDLARYREERRRYDREMAQWEQDRAACPTGYDCGY